MRMNKVITKGKYYDFESRSLKFCTEIYGDQSGEFVSVYWSLRGSFYFNKQLSCLHALHLAALMDFAKKTRDPLFVFVILASGAMDIHALVCFKLLVRIVFFYQSFTLLKNPLKLFFRICCLSDFRFAAA